MWLIKYFDIMLFFIIFYISCKKNGVKMYYLILSQLGGSISYLAYHVDVSTMGEHLTKHRIMGKCVYHYSGHGGYTVYHYLIENKRLSIWQCCHHWWHRKLSFWQLMVPPRMTKLSNWRSFVFSGYNTNHLKCCGGFPCIDAVMGATS